MFRMIVKNKKESGPYRILHLIETRGPGGAETVFLQLANGMAKKGHHCIAGITGPGWVKEQLDVNGMTSILLPTHGPYDMAFLSSLIKYIRKNKIDIIHSHLFGANVYASFVGMLTGVKVISTFHGATNIWNGNRLLHKMKGRIISKGSSFIVFVSNSLKEEICRDGWLDQSKNRVIYNGVDLEKYHHGGSKDHRTALGYNKGDLIIGMIGNIRKTKGHDYFIKSVAIVKERVPTINCLIAGHVSNEDHERLMRLVREFALEGTVHFLGFRQDADAILSCLDVFILASTSEGFSIATVEALASGIPVVCTRSGGPEEIVTHGKDALLIPIRDEHALADAVCRLLSDKELTSRLAQEGLKTAQQFSLDRMLDNYEALYRKCLQRAS